MRLIIFLFFPVVLLLTLSCKTGDNDGGSESIPKEVNNSEVKINPKFYLEFSGSMKGYDGKRNESDFRKTFISLFQETKKISRVDSTPIFVVNNSIYSYPKTFDDLITASSLFDLNNLGDPSYTNFKVIFDTILEDLQKGEVAFLFSDLIYSSPKSKGKIASKIINESEQLSMSSFSKYADSASVVILKCNSNFIGNYYPFNSPNTGKWISKSRPYYVVMFAKNATMHNVLKQENFPALTSSGNYPGFEERVFFSKARLDSETYFNILENDKNIKGTFNKGDKSENIKGLHAIKDVEPPHNKADKLTLCIAVSLPKKTLGEAYVTDLDNYDIESIKDKFIIKSITPLNTKDKRITHKMIIEAQRVSKGKRTVIIKMKNIFPPMWIANSSSDDDSDTKATNFGNTTFGLAGMFKGIDTAYQTSKTKRNSPFTLELLLED
jgi:hypothetical protein